MLNVQSDHLLCIQTTYPHGILSSRTEREPRRVRPDQSAREYKVALLKSEARVNESSSELPIYF